MFRSKTAAACLLWIPLAAAITAQDLPPEQLFQEAVKLHRAGDYAAAAGKYEAFLRLRPDVVPAISNLGAVYSRLGNYGKAIEQYQRAISLDAANPGVRFNLGLAYYDSGRFAAAVKEFEILLKAQPGNLRAALLLADCRFREGEYRRVIDLLAPFERQAGDNRALLYLLGTALIREKQLDKGQKLIDALLGRGDSAEGRFMLGIMRAMTLDMAGAVTEYEKALKLNPSLPGLHSAAGVAYLNLNQQERAVAEFRAELAGNPNDFDANLMLGVLLRKEDKYDQAAPHLARALEIRPGTPDAGYQLALIELAKGDLPAAQARLEDLTRRFANFVEAHISLATVYYRLKRVEDGNREREIVRKLNAENQAQTLAEVNGPSQSAPAVAPAPSAAAGPVAEPKQAPAATTAAGSKPAPATFEDVAARATEAREAERIDDAVALYRQGLRMNPSWAEGWWYLGTLRYDADRFEEAREAFSKLAALKPKGGPGLAMLGLSEFGLKQYERALTHIEEARSYGLGDNEELKRVVRFHSAILQTRFGQPEAALRILQYLARSGPRSESLTEALGLATLRLPWLPSEIPAPKREVVRLAGQAQAFIAERNREAAGKVFQELAAKYPSEKGAHYSYGVFLLGEDADAAFKEFERELAISPKDVPTHLQMAFECLRRGDYRAGLRHGETAVSLAPDSFAARNALGRLLLGDDQVAPAIQQLEAGVRLAPDSPETRFALAQAYARAGRTQDAARERNEFKRLEELRRKRDSAAAAAATESTRPPG